MFLVAKGFGTQSTAGSFSETFQRKTFSQIIISTSLAQPISVCRGHELSLFFL